jgi:large subunit ribosomal protein L21
MFAVIKTGGKQYKVAENDVINIEKLEAEDGASITFDEVLMVGDKVGTPTVSGATVAATVESTFKDRKVIVFKKQRRQNHRRKKGHRQTLTRVRITAISG